MKKTTADAFALTITDAINDLVRALGAKSRVFTISNPGPIRDIARDVAAMTGLPRWHE
jgi:hypothetical protein